jgi:outer membrane protein assembly factor BamB
MKQNNLFILSNGKVAAINKKDGSIIWEIKLKHYVKNAATMSAVGKISLEGDKLYIGVSGILVCLYAKDGSLAWANELKGWGYSFVSMANVNNDASAAAMQAATSAAALAATTAATASV